MALDKQTCVNDLVTTITSLEEEVAKVRVELEKVKQDNKAAVTRLRNSLLLVKKLAHEGRADAILVKHAINQANGNASVE